MVVGGNTIAVKLLEIIAVFFPLATSFLSSTRRLPRENRFILPWQVSIIEDNDVGNGKVKHSLTVIVYSLTTKFLMSSTVINSIYFKIE